MTAVDTARDERAWELMQSVHRIIQKGDRLTGDWLQAASALEEAAAIHGEAGRDYDQGRCLQLAATLRRSAGDTARARLLAERAASVAPPDPTLAVSIATERAETASAESRYQDAAGLWEEAVAKAREAGAKPEGLSAMLRSRGRAWMAVGQTITAQESFEEAASLLETALGKEAAGLVRTEHAGVLLDYGLLAEASDVLDAIDLSVSAHLRAEALVMRARAARTAAAHGEAIECARQARDAALEAVAPVSYFAAGLELAQAFDAQGDHAGAYGALATAWATLGDLLGKSAAQSWVEPVLLAYQMKWGEQAFAEARRAYEAQRRAAKTEGKP